MTKLKKDIFADKKILVVGDIMMDRYICGNVSRISPEAPVPIVDVEDKTEILGGATNVAHNLVTLGAKAILCGTIGADTIGGTILREVSNLDLPINTIIIDPDRPTTIKTRVIGNNHQIIRFDEESRERIKDKFIERIVEMVESNIKNVDGIIVSDYNKGVVSPPLMSKLREVVNLSTFIISDPHKDNFESHKYVNIMVPNKEAVSVFCGFEIKDDEDLRYAAKKLFHGLVCGSILITRGKEGMTLFESKDRIMSIQTDAKEVFDVSGAGDTVVAALSLGLASGMDIKSAVRLSNKAAGIVVGKMGTATLNIEELNEVL